MRMPVGGLDGLLDPYPLGVVERDYYCTGFCGSSSHSVPALAIHVPVQGQSDSVTLFSGRFGQNFLILKGATNY